MEQPLHLDRVDYATFSSANDLSFIRTRLSKGIREGQKHLCRPKAAAAFLFEIRKPPCPRLRAASLLFLQVLQTLSQVVKYRNHKGQRERLKAPPTTLEAAGSRD